MTFIAGNDPFCGIVKSFADIGWPKLTIHASDCFESIRSWDKVLEYSNEESHYLSNKKDGLNAYYIIQTDKPFLVTHYSFRSHPDNNAYVRAWILDGSLNGSHYERLDTRSESDILKNSGVAHFEINPAKKLYSYFRLKNTAVTLVPDYLLRISALDFYGTFYYKKNSCFIKINYLNKIPFCIFVFI